MQINWNPDKCGHAGICVKSLPEVFTVRDAQFAIDTCKVSDEKIADTVQQCPSGALNKEE